MHEESKAVAVSSSRPWPFAQACHSKQLSDGFRHMRASLGWGAQCIQTFEGFVCTCDKYEDVPQCANNANTESVCSIVNSSCLLVETSGAHLPSLMTKPNVAMPVFRSFCSTYQQGIMACSHSFFAKLLEVRFHSSLKVGHQLKGSPTASSSSRGRHGLPSSGKCNPL